MMKRCTVAILAFLAPLLLLACGGGSSSGPDGDQDTEATDAAEEAGEDLADTPEQDDAEVSADTEDIDGQDETPAPCDATRVTGVSGAVTNADGAPLPGVAVVACVFSQSEGDACLNPVSTGTNGRFAVTVPENRQCMDSLVLRYLPPNLDDAVMTCPLPLGSGGALETPFTPKVLPLPDTSRQTLGVETEPHQVTAHDGSVLTVTPAHIDAFGQGYDDIRILAWDAVTHGWPCFINQSDPPDLLWAILPEADLAGVDSARFDAPNTPHLPSGATVDVYLLGGVHTETHLGLAVPEGQWTSLGTATVSTDGSRIVTDEGQGLPFFTWLGFKVR